MSRTRLVLPLALLVVPALCLLACGALLGVDFDRVAVDPASGEGGAAAETGSQEGGEAGGSCAAEAAACAGKCGNFADACGLHLCADCPFGETCGAGGPNVCAVGTCKPDCAGKPCGAFDGCSGGCDGPCGNGQTCGKNGCRCDSTCSGCCDGDILGVCREGTTSNQCGIGGVACTQCNADRPCTGGVCKKTPHLVTCEQVATNGNCNSVCTFRGLECSPNCPNTVTGMGTIAAFSYENGSCATDMGAVTGVLACAEGFVAGTQSAACCCE